MSTTSADNKKVMGKSMMGFWKAFRRPLRLTIISLIALESLHQRPFPAVSAFQPTLLTQRGRRIPVTHRCRSVNSAGCLRGSSDDQPSKHEEVSDPSRRHWFASVVAAAVSTISPAWQPAHATLLQFPCPKLKNRYHFMRAGVSALEAEDILASNALFLTNREENALTAEGASSVVEACRIMREQAVDAAPTVAYHSLAAHGMDTADLVARTLLLARDRLLPEFTYLDPRGVGLWDNSRYGTTRAALAALDDAEAGPRGSGGRPPANEDGTPNETLGDQFIRLRQFFSLQESRTSGETILVIFPDGTGPALASALIAGIPLNQCHALEYAPGEIRLDITQARVLEDFARRREDPAYLTMLEEGRESLAALRSSSSSSSSSSFVSLKDQRADERRLEDDRVFAAEQKRKRNEAERVRQEALTRLRQAEEEAQRARKNWWRREQQEETQRSGSDANADSFSLRSVHPLAAAATLGATSAGVALALNRDNVADADDDEPSFSVYPQAESSTGPVSSSLYNNSQPPPSPHVPVTGRAEKSDDRTPPAADAVEEELESLRDAQDRFATSVLESPAARHATTTAVADSADDDAGVRELATLEEGKTAVDAYLDSAADDGAGDWLRVLAEIRDEDD